MSLNVTLKLPIFDQARLPEEMNRHLKIRIDEIILFFIIKLAPLSLEPQ